MSIKVLLKIEVVQGAYAFLKCVSVVKRFEIIISLVSTSALSALFDKMFCFI